MLLAALTLSSELFFKCFTSSEQAMLTSHVEG